MLLLKAYLIFIEATLYPGAALLKAICIASNSVSAVMYILTPLSVSLPDLVKNTLYSFFTKSPPTKICNYNFNTPCISNFGHTVLFNLGPCDIQHTPLAKLSTSIHRL